MKKLVYWTWLMALCALGANAQRNVMEDESAEQALLTWRNPANIQVGLVYRHLSRPILIDNHEDTLQGDIVDVAVGVSPWPWLLLYGQAGASNPRLDAIRETPTVGAGGLVGARLNVWQLYEGLQETAWRFTLQLAGQYAFRTSQDHGDGDIQWAETLVMLPLNYHLSFAQSFRHSYLSEFQSMGVYIGPAYSKLDGTWTRHEVETDFEEAESFGVVAGVDLWLLENLSFGVRADWFERTTLQLNVQYRF